MTRANLFESLSPRQAAGIVLVTVVLLLQALYWGWNLGCFALADPDSCWLVATGRLILEQGLTALRHDQFAWTLNSTSAPTFVLYQWLSELAFALVFNSAGSQGLLLLAALLSGLAFVALPLLSGHLRDSRFIPLVVVVMLAFNSALYHMPLRPEIFSYLYLSVLFSGSLAFFASTPKPGKLPLVALILLLFFALWANCHTGFVIGLVYLFCLLLFALFKSREMLPASIVAFVAALLGTLCQPYGVRLWAYLPHLFFADINKLNVELTPLHIAEFASADLLPLALLTAIFAVMIVLVFRQKSNQPFVCLLAQLAISVLLLGAAISCRRLIPFYAVSVEYFLLMALAPSLQKQTRYAASLTVTLPVVTMLMGAWLSGHILQIDLPSSTGGFIAPVGALSYIKQSRPPGNIYNDAQYGDLMIYRFGKNANVFIDTRFDLYGDKLTYDYYKIANARDNWLELLDEYKIDWLFVMSDYQAVRPLKARGWQQLYSDPVSVVLQRPRHDLKQAGQDE